MALLAAVASASSARAAFALIFKRMPHACIAWRNVLPGALVTFGAAASVVALLVYFSAQILLPGAEFTWACARVLGSRREPAAGSQPAGANLRPHPPTATR